MEYKIPLWQHQLAALDAARRRNCFALFFEQGTGKTATLINILREKWAELPTLRTIVLCPQIVVENWKREFLAHSEKTSGDILCLIGTGKKRAEALASVLGGKPSIVVTNYESLNMPAVLEQLVKFNAHALVLDESHKCKDTTAKRTKHALKLAETARYRYILSGTPIVNSAFDIFSQYRIMDHGLSLGNTFRQFKERFFIDENAGMNRQSYFPDWQPKTGALEEINSIIAKSSMRVKKEECLDLPPLVRQVVDVELSGEQLRVYKEIEKEAVSAVGNGIVSADLAIKQALRLQQIASGFVKLDDGSVKVFDENPKARALEELFSQIPEPHKIIVWCVFRRDYEAVRHVCEKAGLAYEEITGETPASEKQVRIDLFNDGFHSESRTTRDVRVLIAHPASAGVGANLTKASYAIFYSRNFSLENDLQAEARNYRGGSEIHRCVTRIDIVARGTIDTEVQQALAAKMNISEVLLQTLRNK